MSNANDAGVKIAHAAQQILAPSNAPVEQPYGWTLDQAEERISHINATKKDLIRAIAYLACQWHGARNKNGDDEMLALMHIRRIVHEFEARKSAL